MSRTRSSQKNQTRGRSTSRAPIKNQAKEESIEKTTRKNRQTSTAGKNRNQSQSQQNTVAFSKGSYIAFVDPAGDLETFKIGLLLNDMRDVDEEVQIDVYELVSPLTFKRSGSKVTIFEYQIITDVPATVDKTAKKNQHQVKITKQQENKIYKLHDGVIQKLEAQKDEEEDEDDDEEDEEEDDESEEESEEAKEELTKEIKGRRIVKSKEIKSQALPKRNARSASKKKIKESKKSVKKADKTSKKKESKTPKKQAKKIAKSEDEEMGADDEEESRIELNVKSKVEDESLEMINTSSKKKGGKKQRALTQVPKVGEKRSRKTKQILDEQEGDEDDGEGEGEESDSSQIVKKRKVSKGKAQVVKTPKAKKAPKRPTVFKKGKWNPDIELVVEDKYRESKKNELFLDCCIRCNNKNIIRAAVSQNFDLLKKGIAATKKISQLNAYWSPEVKRTAFEDMIENNLDQFLELTLHPYVSTIPQYSTYEAERDKLYNSRVLNPQYLLNYVDTGMVSNMAYGARVRKVQMTRGNRQGNNAFQEYQDNNQRNPVYYLSSEEFIWKVLTMKSLTVKSMQTLAKLYAQIESTWQSYVYIAVRAGNRKIAYDIINKMLKFPNWGFNNLHAEVLADKPKFEKILKVSTAKKCNTNKDITPIHCACINPDGKVLKELLDINPDLQIVDGDLRRPIHYAAACESSEPLQVLLQMGASLMDVDNQKFTCLHLAAIVGRADNIRLILQTSPQLLNLRNKKSMTAIAYASKYGHTDCVQVLLEFKAKLNIGAGTVRMTPLIFAAAHGHHELVEFLLDNKARVLGKDKYKRTALTLAVRNGFTKIASLLLQRGSEWNHPDSSMNTPLHYASAYGWIDCMDLLIKAGADINAGNSWKVTPINIAMLMNHQGCVKKLLEQPNVDVNGKDEKGRTLLILSIIGLNDESIDFIKYLLEKGADPNIVDLQGQSALHYIAKYNPMNHIDQQYGITQDAKKAEFERLTKIQVNVAQLLLDYNAELTLKDKNNTTPFAICLENDNAALLELLQKKISLNKEPSLFFDFTTKIFDEKYQKILISLLKNEHPSKEAMNIFDDQGLTPFLKFLQEFTTQEAALVTTISYKVNSISLRLGFNCKEVKLYKITNADLFDKFADVTNYYSYNNNLSQEEKMDLSYTIFNQIVVTPLINLLKQLVQYGADPHAKVFKLKRYREEEKLKQQQLALIAENGIFVPKEEEKVKKRAEIIEEKRRGGRGKYGKTLRTKPVAFGQSNQFYPGHPLYNAQDTKDVYDVRNGEKVLREYGQFGLRNAFHFLMKYPNSEIFNYLMSEKIPFDDPDYDEVTPFNLLSKDRPADKILKSTFDRLIKLDVRIDYADIKGRTPFLNYYENVAYVQDYAYKLLDLGANVNQMDQSGLFALKYSLIRRDHNQLTKLLEYGANINQIDNKGRNLLHHAVNMSSATADATFETEQFLIDNGVEINVRDHFQRTPIHYAFVKIGDWKNSTQIDPIETISSLCGQKGLELDVPDKWLKTPLHYASQRGASICAIYMIKRGANLENKDIYGNTSLGTSLLYKHYNYGIILIQNQITASVKPLVFREDAEKIQKMWNEEEKKKKGESKNKEEDEVMEDEEDEGKKSKTKKSKKHRSLFDNDNKMMDSDYGDEYDDEYDDEDDDEDNQHYENVFNQQNAFGMKVFAAPAKRAAPAFGMFGGGAFQYGAQPIAKTQAKDDSHDHMPKDEEGVSMFKLAIRGGQQGLAYLMLDNGYDLMLAMQDAMDEKKFLLVLTLLSKNPDDKIIQQCNSKQQNLFHILSMNASGCSFEHLKRIYETLMKRGVNCAAKDQFKRTALHYAVLSGSLQLVELLLSSANKYNPNEVDEYGHTPLSLHLNGTSCMMMFYLRSIQPAQNNIFNKLCKAGADVNFVYPEKQFKPDFDENTTTEDDYNAKGPYKTTILINIIRQTNRNSQKVAYENIIGLLEYGAKLNICDSDGRDPIIHAVMKNNHEILQMLLDNSQQSQLNKKLQDKAGKSAAHYVVNPIKFGSYENTDILKLLHRRSYSLELKDLDGKTPLHYAYQQESGVMAKEISKLLNVKPSDDLKLQRQTSVVNTSNWPESKVDFEADSEELVRLAHEREKQEQKDKKIKIPADKTGKFEESYSVFYDANEKPWDCYLTKVDLKNGIYGDYVFYKMQLLHDSNRDLYVVFTRWGRIGETGMNQRTPFNNVEEAKKEFKNIFKQKTGGNDFENLDAFNRVKKKYNLTKVNYVNVNYKDYLAPFDFEKCPKSRLNKQTYELFEEVANVTMYQKAMQTFGLDLEVMPFSAVQKESIVQARQILMDISEAIKEDIEVSKQGINADYEKLTEIKERIAELTSRYYEIIPLQRYRDQIAPPLSSQHVVKEQYDNLESLTNIEYASKMLLGALFKQKEQNPIDYVFKAVNMLVEPLDQEGPEFQVIKKYIDNTKGNYFDQFEIANVFKIQRKGEAEQIQAYKEIPNHFLLYHGSPLFNFLGILSQGLRIAPPEAPPTGYMFGKGVYFADMFEKSFQYAQRGYNQQDSYLMMMCEVALGNMKKLYQAEYVEKLDPQFHSVKGMGRNGPNYDDTIILPNSVKIPFGDVINYYDGQNQNHVQLAHNEYIVYNTSQIRMRYLIQVQKKKPVQGK